MENKEIKLYGGFVELRHKPRPWMIWLIRKYYERQIFKMVKDDVFQTIVKEQLPWERFRWIVAVKGSFVFHKKEDKKEDTK